MSGQELAPVEPTDLATLEMSEAHKKAFQILRMAALKTDELVEMNRDNIDGLARAQVMLEVIKKDLTMVLDRIGTYMAENAPSYQFSVAGVGTYQKCQVGAKDSWDTEGVLDMLIKRSYEEREADKETGEIEFPTAALKRILLEFARLEWRSTPFKNRSIDVSQYREREGGRPSVRRLTKAPK